MVSLLFFRAYLYFLGPTNGAWCQSWPAQHVKGWEGGIPDNRLMWGGRKKTCVGKVCWQLHKEAWRWTYKMHSLANIPSECGRMLEMPTLRGGRKMPGPTHTVTAQAGR